VVLKPPLRPNFCVGPRDPILEILNIFLRFNPSSRLDLEPERPLKNAPFCSISASGSNFNPRNTQCTPVVKIIAFLELKQKLTFFKGLPD
jgi:hypothetical protein